jgi:tRNA dimethylallyltransferase
LTNGCNNFRLKKKLLIVVAGPTAVGKTKVAIDLAIHYKCPVISFDSRQVYAEMCIGNARPTAAELEQAPHYFIGTHSVQNVFTSGMYETEALQKLEEIFQYHDYCVAVGGSGLYINALCYGIDEIPTSEEVRNQLIERWQNEGLETLKQEVLQADPEFYHSADMKNPRRVIRALEVFQVSGKPYTWYRKNQAKPRNFETAWLGLNLERELLNQRINDRVDQMIEAGLVDEVNQLSAYQHLKALKTVGYQELFDFINGDLSLDRAIELIKRNSRNYAKKQLVWFKKNPAITWFRPTDTDGMRKTVDEKFLQINF